MAEPKKPDSRAPSNPSVTGPTKKLDPTHSTAPVRRGVPETTRPVARPELVTEGMKAHRREIERRKRQAAIEKLHDEQQSADALRSLLEVDLRGSSSSSVAGFGYRSLQNTYGNQWPMWDVWIFLARGPLRGLRLGSSGT